MVVYSVLGKVIMESQRSGGEMRQYNVGSTFENIAVDIDGRNVLDGCH